ncbi:uncharacterized protein LOC134686138 [Mytilus trossulus]|uniref:uncharacterized protein LOC134686138 n=1 Tax=Mytilus trossulus TaxID=6551 RepID=UPI00300547AF
MELSNILTYAADLKSLLIVYDNSVVQLSMLDTKIHRLDQQIFTANIEGASGYGVHLQSQKSVTVGVKKVFEKLKTKKWQEIQELSALILQSNDPSHPTPTATLDSQPETDTMATSFTEMFCAYSRTA